MPGMPVYQDSPSNLKNQIYGSDGSNVINVKVDDTGRLKIATDVAAPLEVAISQTSDSIVVYGNDGTDNKALKTNATGQLDIRPLTDADTVSVVITEASDSITVYGSDGTDNKILKTNATGQLDIRPLTDADTVSVSITEASDSITVYGSDGTDNKILKTNATGQLDIRPLTDADTVSVSITEASDSIVIYGNDGTNNKALKTDDAGILQVNYNHTFIDETLLTDGATTNVYQYIAQQEISDMSSYAFFIKNSGVANSAKLQVQLSPNGTDWVNDSSEIELAHTTNTILNANKFLKYIRVGYKSAVDDASTTLTVIFQGQD